jgi:hypothetical protein
VVIVCWICHDFAGTNLKKVVRHMGAVHARDAMFRVICGIDSCTRKYVKFSSFKKHLYRHHKRQLLHTSLAHTSLAEASWESVESVQDNVFVQQMENENQQLSIHENKLLEDNSSTFVTDKSSEMKIAALFLLKTQEVHKVSHASLLGIIDVIEEVFQSKIDSIKRKVMLHLSSDSSTNNDELTEIFNTESNTIFPGLRTRYHQEKYYKERLGLLEPIERHLGQRLVKRNKKSKPYIKIIHDYMYDIPLLQSLKQILSNALVFNEVLLI